MYVPGHYATLVSRNAHVSNCGVGPRTHIHMEAHALAKQCPYRLPSAVCRLRTHLSLHCLTQLTGT